VSAEPDVELIEWVNKRTGEVELIPNGVDPAWATNPGKTREETALKALGTKATAAKEDLASGVIRSHLNDRRFEDWLKAPKGSYPVAAMSDASMSAVKANQRVVWLSKDTVAKQLRNHPELTVADYRVLPYLIDSGIIIQDGERTLVFFSDRENLYRAALKTTDSGKGNFLTSLIITDERELRRMQSKGRTLRR
jgi:hypothetical protein